MKKQLPKNWVETELGNYAILKNGYAFKSNDFQNDGIPVVRISNIRDFKIEIENSTCVDESKLKSDFIVSKGDILIAMSGATTGKYGVFEQDIIALQNQRVGNLKPIVESLSNRRFLLYLLGSLKKEIEEKAYGAAQPNISPKLIESINIYLPPLPEQNRIVTKLDALFAQLETIKNSMANVPLLLKDFRQQVLTQAVTGKLTEEWRKGKNLNIIKSLDQIEKKRNKLLNKRDNKEITFDNPTEIQIPKEWKNVSLWELSYVVTSGSRDWSKFYSDEGAYFVRSAEINNNKLRLDEAIKVNLPEKIEGKRSLIEKGNLLITITGANVGKCALIEDDIPESYVSQSVAIIKIVHSNISKYVHLTLLSRNAEGSQLENMAYGMGRPVLSLPQIKSVKIPFPSLAEQQEIVSRVESLFAKADAIEKQYESLKAKIDNLPQALLHKAFKGELTEQLESDGDARELLKEIQALKATSGKVGKKVGKTVKHYNEKEVVLDRVAEPDNTDAFTAIMSQLNFDYEIAAIASLTFQRFKHNYGKKYMHKMFSNIELLNTLTVLKELAFEEKGWGMFSPQIKKAIDDQKFIQFEEINDTQKVIALNFKHFKEVSAWMKEEENKEFISQVNEMLTIYENPIINKKMDNIELFNTVLECMKVLKTDDFKSIYTKMENWPMEEEGFATKAAKFNPTETQAMISFIKELYQK